MRFNRKASTILSAAAVSGAVLIATGAIGQDATTLPPQGDFALTFSLVDAYNAPPVMIGENQMAQAVNYIAHLFNDAGADSFLNYAVGNCASFQTTDVAANTIEINGYCSYRDADGDRAFEHFATDGAVPVDAVTMTSEWVGGTGKYADLTGTFTTEASGTVQNGEATLIGGRKSGSYTIAGAEAAASAGGSGAASAGGSAAADQAALMAALMSEGEDLFNHNCSGCHGTNGLGQEAGLVGPKLVGNDFLSSAGATIGQIMVGNPEHGMPPFADRLNDREIAAIATYVRNSWGNSFGIVPERSVTIRRGG
jgi:mono/diheme cytochrome c family protein